MSGIAETLRGVRTSPRRSGTGAVSPASGWAGRLCPPGWRSLLLLWAAGLALSAARAAPANVLIMISDDQGWADVPWRSSPARMPNLDRLRQSGVELMRFYSAPVCSPTRAALYTGRSAMQLGVRDPFAASDPGLSPLEHLISETFRAAGYQTALTGKWHLGATTAGHLPNARGFDRFYGFLGGSIDYNTHAGDNASRVDWQRDGQTLNEAGYSTDLIGDEEVRLLRTRDPAKPFFHVVAFNAPHTPLQAPADLLRNYPDLTGNAQIYAAMLESLDLAIGRILAELTAQKLDADTLVIYLSDNGGPGNGVARNTPLKGSKSSVYDGGIRTPCVWRWPGVLRAGATSDQFLAAHDLFPTVAAAMGVTPRNRLPWEGVSVWDALRGATAPVDRSFTIAASSEYAQFEGRWKLVSRGNVNELYDVVGDPSETTNVAAAQPAIVARLGAALTAAVDRSLNAGTTGAPWLGNLSVRAAAGGAAGTPILGFVVTGGTKRVLVRGVGPGLAPFGVTGLLANPALEVWQGTVLIRSNDDWLAADAATMAASGAFALPAANKDAAIVASLSPAAYTALTQSADGGSGVALMEIYDAEAGGGVARLVNASARAFVGTGAAILIPGVSVDGGGSGGFLIRAAGPALGKYGVANFLADPVLTVFRGNEIVASNDDWGVGTGVQYNTTPGFFAPAGQIAAAAAANGAFAFDSGSRDAAVLVSLPAGANYTIQVSGKNGTTGTALVEFYLLR